MNALTGDLNAVHAPTVHLCVAIICAASERAASCAGMHANERAAAGVILDAVAAELGTLVKKPAAEASK